MCHMIIYKCYDRKKYVQGSKERFKRNIIFLPTLTYGSRLGHGIEHSRNQECFPGVEISYLRGACSVTGWEGESNESVYERCGMGP